ncbi:hypothetical protein Tco_0319270 [Tanacetum coccineum]
MSYNDIRPIFEKIWDFNQNIEPMDTEHGSGKQKSPQKSPDKSPAKEKSPEKFVEEESDTQEELKQGVKEPAAKRKKSIPRKSTRKRQKLEEDAEKDELKGFLDIVPREEAPIEVESISTKFHVLSSIQRLVKNRYSASSPEGFDLMLWGDLHTLFEPDEEDEIWKDQHEYKLLSWRLYDFCGIHILLMENGLAIHMLTEKKYPLSQEMLTKMLSRKLEVDHESSQAFELLRMTKVIKGEFEKIKDVKVEDVSLTCDTSLEIFNMEVSRLSGMDNDLFTYKVEVANIPCNSVMDDDLEDETDDDMGYDPSDVAFIEWLRSKKFNYKTMDQYTMKALWIYWIRGDDEVELTDEESSDDEDEIAEVFRIDTNIFDYETPICSAFNEFNYLLKVDPDLLTKDITGFKTYDDYKNDWIYEWNKDVPWVDEKPWTDTGVWTEPKPDYEWYEALDDCELKEEALRNKAIMDGVINNDESCCELKRKWNIYTNYDDAYEINHEDNENKELCEIHEPPVCNIRKYMMIKYSFNDDDEYVAIKEDEYDYLIMTRRDTCKDY